MGWALGSRRCGMSTVFLSYRATTLQFQLFVNYFVFTPQIFFTFFFPSKPQTLANQSMASSSPLPILFLVFSAVALPLLLVPSAVAANVEYCNKRADYPVKVSGVVISPDPVVRGEPATFNISATTGTNLTDGKLVIDVKYFWFHVHEETHDLCSETSCPVSVGSFVLSHQQTLPSYTPPGSYTITMTLTGENGKQLTCITFDFGIGFIADNMMPSLIYQL